MNSTPVLAPLGGRLVALGDVEDPVFAQGMVGWGVAVDPPPAVVDVVAPVAGTVVTLLPHAYVVLTSEHVGVLVHLGLDTVRLDGNGFQVRVEQGDSVSAGQIVITYDVPEIRAAGLNPVVPVVVMDERDRDSVVTSLSAGAAIAGRDLLFTVTR